MRPSKVKHFVLKLNIKSTKYATHTTKCQRYRQPSLKENNSIWIGSDPTSTTDTAEYNTALGVTALDAITTGDRNAAIGYGAGGAVTTGASNVAIGVNAYKTAKKNNIKYQINELCHKLTTLHSLYFKHYVSLLSFS